MKIALVDDEQNYLDEMAGLVCDFGAQRHCHVETVPFLNAEGFFKAFGDGSFSAGGCFDAVFMDIYMDGMDGVTAAQQVCPRVSDFQLGLYAGRLLLPCV